METARSAPDGKPASSEDGDGRDIPYESKDNEGEGSARLGRVVFKAGYHGNGNKVRSGLACDPIWRYNGMKDGGGEDGTARTVGLLP
uniref:Uncharacterized protein n=1 Tax=Oryza glumipatula TaxID=40148 RepID=A0A0E0AJ35_9ORYZ